MNIQEFEKINIQDNSFLKKSKYIFDSYDFHRINAHKVEKVVLCQFGHGNKTKASLFIAIDGEKAQAPYSAPFAMIEEYKECSIEEIDNYIVELNAYLDKTGVKDSYFKLPPMIYDQHRITKLISSMIRNGYSIFQMELSFEIIIKNEEEYLASLHRNARKNLQHARELNYSLIYCSNEKLKRDAYEIIKINRVSNNYRLAMTWENVKETIAFTEHDFFILKLEDKEIASAIIFRVTDEVYQVVYWGDIPGYSEARPVNMLAYFLNEYYYAKGVKILDIGPSMLDGQPNYGLCSFKESIGCEISGKYILHR